MVVPLRPGKFYGSSLPRPRIYTDIQFNSDRVDPPVSVLDPLMSWANEAHWSMGGLSFKRLRLQGRIEGNVNRLKAQRERLVNGKDDELSPPPAPMVVKRRRFFDLNEDDVESGSEGDEMVVKRKAKRAMKEFPVKNLSDDFERVADVKEKSFTDGIGGDVMKIVEEVNVKSEVAKKKKRRIVKGLKKGRDELQQSGTGTVTMTRSSPRLAKRG
ncbi:hypothetical protein V6N13_102506 [Hibiscus sabdariffa]|uniref:Uncharacterized protein n=2 Tax=Hibiscus sabdariffa TaxID=183260 RepID=A0ABR1ZAW0_9ROSI